MEGWHRRLCASVSAPTAARAGEIASGLPPAVELVELRADRLDPAEVRSGAWKALPAGADRSWVFTWRSPAEGGAVPRPAGVLAAAGAAGFRWIDVEARELEGADPEAASIPVERRWVSRHAAGPPAAAEDLLEAWSALRRHPAALHKLVVPADRFAVNDWVLGLVREAAVAGESPFTVFAQGWIGHPSRILGCLEGNAVTFAAPEGGEATAPGQPTVRTACEVYALPQVPPEPRLFGVLGHPARHSRSPELMNHAFRLCGERALYLPLESPEPEPVLDWLRRGDLRGLSVTAPFKLAAAGACDRLEPGAARLGVVNTMWREGNRLVGDNTDLAAAGELLAELELGRGGRLALVGAGGAAAAVAAAAGGLGATVTVFNRSPRRGRTLAARLGAAWGGAPGDLDPAGFEAVANATPLGRDGELPEAWAERDWAGTAVLDLAYAAGTTGLVRLAEARGLPVRDGLAFLVRQGTRQFHRFLRRNLEPDAFAGGLVR